MTLNNALERIENLYMLNRKRLEQKKVIRAKPSGFVQRYIAHVY